MSFSVVCIVLPDGDPSIASNTSCFTTTMRLTPRGLKGEKNQGGGEIRILEVFSHENIRIITVGLTTTSKIMPSDLWRRDGK